MDLTVPPPQDDPLARQRSGLLGTLGSVVRFLVGLVRDNLLLKLLSFTVALLVWIVVAEDESAEWTREVSLVVQLPESLEQMSTIPHSVQIRFRGSRSRLDRLEDIRPEMFLDLRDVRQGSVTISLEGRRISNLPQGVVAISYSPSSLTFEFDERIERQLPIKVRTQGDLPAGYRLSTTEVRPQRITLVGSAQELKPLQHVFTQEILLSDLKQTHEGRYRVVDLPPHVRLKDAREVDVSLTILPIVDARRFDGIPVVVPPELEALELVPPSINVVLQGHKPLLEALSADKIRAELMMPQKPVDIPRLRRASLSSQPLPDRPWLQLTWPNSENVTLLKVEPGELRFKPRKGQGATQTPARRRP